MWLRFCQRNKHKMFLFLIIFLNNRTQIPSTQLLFIYPYHNNNVKAWFFIWFKFMFVCTIKEKDKTNLLFHFLLSLNQSSPCRLCPNG